MAFAARSPRAGGDRRGAGSAGRRRSAGDRDATPPPEPAAELDPEGRARQICLDQLAHGPRTRAELAAVLTKRGVEDEAAERVLSRFAEVGMIDDALFAQMWVTSRHRGRGLAGRALEQELRRKGVDAEHIDAAVDTLDDDVQLATARALVARKVAATRGLDRQARVRRLAGMLARKGYPAGTAFSVVREALAADGESELDDLLALQDSAD